MSPLLTTLTASVRGFPRVSGDEPQDANSSDLQSEFSPRERG